VEKKIKLVESFHSCFNIGIGKDYKKKLSEKKITLRYNLMKEENEEYLDAAISGDYIEVADALGDQLYVLLGTIIEHGMQDVIEDVFTEIHKSNMSKLGKDGKPIYKADGKVAKGEDYSIPNVGKILK
jgi:predicted HAD superfamily Cof-like phosphohydrolase